MSEFAIVVEYSIVDKVFHLISGEYIYIYIGMLIY